MSDRTQIEKPGVLTLEVPRPTLARLSERFPDGVNVLVCPPEALAPEFIRMPDETPGAVCPVTGLSRSKLRDMLIDAGARVNVRVLRKKGATRGVVLIHRQSLVDYINTLPRPEWCAGEEMQQEAKDDG